ncbi:MAG: hypothetical protein O3A46_11135, partial [Candidatus Poribacteria bacterium]|nr:hypothetical protein [Candidatus Poribacteria bacterium]
MALSRFERCCVAVVVFIGSVVMSNVGLAETVSREHPRLLGSRDDLKRLADERPNDYARMVDVARNQRADDWAKMISMGLVAAIDEDETLGRAAVEMAMRTVNGPIRRGHVTFGHDLARCAFIYDLCHAYWTEDERAAFHRYMNATVDANVNSETHVFHNAWFGYKHWGIGIAAYATWYENERAPEILDTLRTDWL